MSESEGELASLRRGVFFFGVGGRRTRRFIFIFHFFHRRAFSFEEQRSSYLSLARGSHCGPLDIEHLVPSTETAQKS